ncbi:DNA photolyase family protein [bacterium]|nr:DNA photolyase family protein [bacterium]
MSQDTVIHWFRQDLRLRDNPALLSASKRGRVLPVFILDEDNAGKFAAGGASRWWLSHSLASLSRSLGGCLSIYKGNPSDVLSDIAHRLNVSAIYWNRCYEPWRMHRDAALKIHFKKLGIDVQSHNGSLLWEPWTIRKDDDTPHRVFTPFYRKGCLASDQPRVPLSPPEQARYIGDSGSPHACKPQALLPRNRWHEKLEPYWQIGEEGAHARLKAFLEEGLPQYKTGRNYPSRPFVSRLSPFLRNGEISPHQIWHSILNLFRDKHIDHFCSELGWREFAYHLLYHYPDLPTKNLRPMFDTFPWKDDGPRLHAWKKGETGIPMVDAGMRELWETGYMHNRVRMIVGSFLVKNLGIHWKHGERWFWDTLVDADLANNSAGWQWVAGSGSDAATYFRMFNPVMQGQKFDPDGDYVRRWIPEIASLPTAYLFNPWEAPDSVLSAAGIKLGETYPAPMIDLNQSRDAAQAAFESLKKDYE